MHIHTIQYRNALIHLCQLINDHRKMNMDNYQIERFKYPYPTN